MEADARHLAHSLPGGIGPRVAHEPGYDLAPLLLGDEVRELQLIQTRDIGPYNESTPVLASGMVGRADELPPSLVIVAREEAPADPASIPLIRDGRISAVATQIAEATRMRLSVRIATNEVDGGAKPCLVAISIGRVSCPDAMRVVDVGIRGIKARAF